MDQTLNSLLQQLPFVTVIQYNDMEFIGIIINYDMHVTSFYDFSMLTGVQREEIIELGEVWWWESNRQVPINIFLFSDMQQFSHSIRSISTKEIVGLSGPSVSLNSQRVSKKRTVTLVRTAK